MLTNLHHLYHKLLAEMLAEMSEETPTSEGIPRTASKQSVDKALELIRARTRKPSKRKVGSDEEKQARIESYCVASPLENHRRKLHASSGFSHSYAVYEMRHALAHFDWAAMQEMFPLLLKCYHAEPIAWRYAFIIYLCSPISDQFQFQEFIEMCMGYQKTDDDDDWLQSLIALKTAK